MRYTVLNWKQGSKNHCVGSYQIFSAFLVSLEIGAVSEKCRKNENLPLYRQPCPQKQQGRQLQVQRYILNWITEFLHIFYTCWYFLRLFETFWDFLRLFETFLRLFWYFFDTFWYFLQKNQLFSLLHWIESLHFFVNIPIGSIFRISLYVPESRLNIIYFECVRTLPSPPPLFCWNC